MSSKNSALASLTAQYTDSENEDDRNSDDDDSPNTENSSESQVTYQNNIHYVLYCKTANIIAGDPHTAKNSHPHETPNQWRQITKQQSAALSQLQRR